MKLVLDASAAVAASLTEEGWALLAGQTLVAPPLLLSEATSVLHENQWRHEISADVAGAARDRLFSAPVSFLAPRELPIEAWRVADRLGWARTYDAEYVALAGILDVPLLTLDERLRRGAGHLVSIIGPADL